MTGRWRLPGPARLISELSDALRAGRSAVLLVPHASVIEGLELVLSRVVGRPWHSVDLAELADRPGTLAERLHDQLGLAGDAVGTTASALIDAPELRGHAVWLQPTQRGATDAVALGAFLRDFSRGAARRDERERPVLMCCARIGDVDPLPVSDAALHRTWWWGRVGPLDTRVVVDSAMAQPRVIADLDVVAEVAAYDLVLADQLARTFTGDLQVDLSPMLDTTSFEPWVGIPDAVRTAGDQVLDEPPHVLRDAWSAGIVDWWGDRLVVHVGCVLHGDRAALRRLTWRGQVAAVMPFVEVGRQRLAYWILERKSLLTDGWEQRDVLALEAGQLHRLMRDHDKLRQAAAAFQLATALKVARHKLAHLEPLERDWLRRNEHLIRATTL